MLLTSESKVFELAPEGLFPAVLGDVIDLGEQETQYGKKRLLSLVYLLALKDSDGNPFRIFKRIAASSHENSNLAVIYNSIQYLSQNRIACKSRALEVSHVVLPSWMRRTVESNSARPSGSANATLLK
jgi:hypothetical protein